MSRNGSGAMSIPNTLVSGATITAAGHNQNYSDIGTELTNSLALDGQSTMTGAFKAANGTVGAPGITFGSDLDSGFYRIGADNIGLALGGALVVNYSATGIAVTGTIAASGGYSGAFAGNAGATFADTVTVTGSSVGFVGGELISTEAGAAIGPVASIYRNSATPAASDFLGATYFYGKDSGGNKTRYAYIVAQITDPTDGSEDSDLYLQTLIAGVDTTILRSSGTQIQVPGSLAVTGAITGSSGISGAGITASAALSGATAAGAMLADQAEQEAGSATNKLVQPGVQHFHPSASKFWATLDGTGTIAVNASYNLTSATDNGTGAYTFNIGTDFSSASYGVATTARSNDGASIGDAMHVIDNNTAPNAGAIKVGSLQRGSNTQLDAKIFGITGFGDQ